MNTLDTANPVNPPDTIPDMRAFLVRIVDTLPRLVQIEIYSGHQLRVASGWSEYDSLNRAGVLAMLAMGKNEVEV